ncbi:hypothetical protein DOY81_005672 [Sarcophaga bullata]|nr:hypothetical protein DOY81_005672 [Sarcophaga bullata]
MSENTNTKIKSKRGKINNKRWTDAEIKQVLEYQREFTIGAKKFAHALPSK